MKKINNMKKLFLLLLFIPLISCSSEEETPVQSVEQTPKPETTPVPTPTAAPTPVATGSDDTLSYFAKLASED